MLPSILSSAIFAFVTSFGNLTVSIFLNGPRLTTLPVQIFVYVDQSLDPSALRRVSAIVIFVTLAVVLLIERIVGLQRFVVRHARHRPPVCPPRAAPPRLRRASLRSTTSPVDRTRRARLPARPERLRQDHDAAA